MNPDRAIFRKLKRSKCLPSLPQVLLKLIDACNNDATSLTELSQITSKDPALTSKVLRLVNSAYFGLMDPITSLEKAVLYLGAGTIKNIAISASVLQTFARGKEDPIFNLRRFWWHSFMCASLARRIAKQAAYKNPEEAFLAGLLHDIGKLILLAHFPEAYGRILEDASPDPVQLIARETALGATHAEVGSWLIRQWHLDPFMADAAAYHHEAPEDIERAFPLVKIVYVANALDREAASGADGEGDDIAKTVLGFTAAQIEEIRFGANKEVTEVARVLDIPVEPPPEAAVDTLQDADDDLLNEIKNISLLYGTLENLLKADSRDAILVVVERGLRILFDAQNLFFFLYDPQTKLLIGNAPQTRAGSNRVRDLALPTTAQTCLAAKSLSEGIMLDSFDQSDLSIADKQIIRLLNSEGMLCLPLVAYQQYVGVIVMGIQAAQASRFSAQRQLLRMFANHAAVCLCIDDLKQKQAIKIQTERMEAASLMARKVVHEVNNPLGIIRNYLKILGLKLPEKHPAQEDIGIIAKEIDRVSQTVRQLNTFSQPGRRKSTPVDVNQLISDQLNLMRKSILAPAGIRDHLCLQEGLPRLAADENRLKQVFLNLIKNAAEAMTHGGTLRIATRHVPETGRRLGENGITPPGAIEITIKDDGPGIAEDVKSRLYEPFISSKAGEHRGLGLSVVHNIIKELKGSITCQTDTKTGTRFSISLPLISIDTE